MRGGLVSTTGRADPTSRATSGGTQVSATDGRIPFRIRLGVTGKRRLPGTQEIEIACREQIRRVLALLPGSTTAVELAVVSQLADGADQLVTRMAEDLVRESGGSARVEVLLPMDRTQYMRDQDFSDRSRDEFGKWISKGLVLNEPLLSEPLTPGKRAAAYVGAAEQLVARSDVLIALWDGGPTGGRGGTAETLLAAAARGKPCIWISTADGGAVRDNLAPGSSEEFFRDVAVLAAVPEKWQPAPAQLPGDVLEPLRSSFAQFERFNGPELGGRLARAGEETLHSIREVPSWVAGPLARAAALASRAQAQFRGLSRALFAFVAAAAAALAWSLSFSSAAVWDWIEFTCLILASVVFLVLRQSDVHGRWLSYRLLAERLRSAHYLAPVGVDFRLEARLEAVYVGSEIQDSPTRAFEEVWDARPPSSPAGSELGPWLAENWIGEQIEYHVRAHRHHHRWYLFLSAFLAVVFLSTIVAAALHAGRVVEDLSKFLSITLPVAGASVGALLTINQHRALAERSARMVPELSDARTALTQATEDTLVSAATRAARVLARETDDWFGAMWFLDVEHP